jgi:PhnB protein
MSIAPYLFFPGTCAEAMIAYCDILGGGDLQIMRYSDAPPGPDGQPSGDAVMHASFTLDQGMLMASDFPEGMTWQGQAGSAVHVTLPEARAPEVFARLAEGGTVKMPFAATFWAKGFGMLTDRFGTDWMVSTPA